jgi:hypothetical protein
MYFFVVVQVYRGLKSCTSAFFARGPKPRSLVFSLGTSKSLVFVPLKNCRSARCAYAANVAGKDLDIFAIGAVSLYHIL